MFKHLHVLLLLFAGLATATAQTAGQLDNSFNSVGFTTYDYGFQDNITDVAVQPADQKILTCGTAITPAFAGQLLIERHNPDGSPDLSFNSTGYTIITDYNESYAYALQVRTDGKILVAGSTADSNYAFSGVVARYLTNGTPDATFGTNGFAAVKISGGDNFLYSMVELPNHQILVGGTALDTAFRNQPVVIRLNENGSIDSAFGVNGVAAIPVTEADNRINKIAVQPDGRIVAAGHYGNPITNDGQFDFDILVARFTDTGLPDSTFSSDGILTDTISPKYIDDIFGLGLASGGHIAVTGYTTLPDFSYDVILLQYDSTGARDLMFGNNGSVQFDSALQDVANALYVQPDGKLLVAGTTGGFMFDNRDILLMRYNTNGTIDSSFGGIGYVATDVLSFMDEGNAVTMQADGKILVAGKANNSNQNDALLMRYYSSDQPNGITNHNNTPTLQLYPNPTANTLYTQLPYPANVTIRNLTGQVLIQQNNAPAGLLTTGVEALAPGSYLFTITGKQGTVTKPFIKQ